MATITTTYKGDMLFESKVGKHTVQIDVPADMGGSDRAPTPPQLFVVSLGSCVAAFIVTYCQKAGIDASDLAVDVSFDKAEDPARRQLEGECQTAACRLPGPQTGAAARRPAFPGA